MEESSHTQRLHLFQTQALWALDALSTYNTNVERFAQNGVIPILHELLVVIPKYGKKQTGSAKDKKKKVIEKGRRGRGEGKAAPIALALATQPHTTHSRP